MRDQTRDRVNGLIAYLMEVGQMVERDTAEVSSTNNHIDIIRHYYELRNAAAAIKEAREAISDLEDRMSRITVPETMRDHGVKTITVIGVGRVTVSHRFSCSMLDKDAGIAWLKENGHGGIVQETVNASTLGAFAKDMLQEQGKELPEIFKTSINPYTSITKVQA